MSLPASMKFIDHGKGGGPDAMRVADGPLPTLKPGDVLIEVAYAGVNRPDVAQRSGSYPPPPGASPYIGLEVAGRVAALGEGVSQWRLGDAVCALTPGGGYAEYCAAPASNCLPVPKGMPLKEAAALPEARSHRRESARSDPGHRGHPEHLAGAVARPRPLTRRAWVRDA